MLLFFITFGLLRGPKVLRSDNLYWYKGSAIAGNHRKIIVVEEVLDIIPYMLSIKYKGYYRDIIELLYIFKLFWRSP